ncbi:MAG: hypothetical protein V3S64_01525, partial [bacterium]
MRFYYIVLNNNAFNNTMHSIKPFRNQPWLVTDKRPASQMANAVGHVAGLAQRKERCQRFHRPDAEL